MDIRGMHYDFKQKLNKLDSSQYRNLRVPEIDWKLNEAVEIFVKSIARPRKPRLGGFEEDQRSIDDIRTLVIDAASIDLEKISDKEYIATLPSNYLFYSSSKVTLTKESCGEKTVSTVVIQHDDRYEESSFNNSSYEWGEVNIRFFKGGIKVFSDGTFVPTKIFLDYIKKPVYIHNAQDFLPSQTYILSKGVELTGSVDCELPEHTHREIVDIAVMIASGDLDMPNYQVKQAKVNLTN